MRRFLNKLGKIILETLPILVMIALIPTVSNDYLLSAIDILIILLCLLVKKENLDLTFLIIGFFTMILAESIFVSTGVEVFTRRTLIGLMPLWLPFIWAYSFVVMKRSVNIIGKSGNVSLGPIVIGVNSIAIAKKFYINVFGIKIERESEHYLGAYLNDREIEIEEDSPHRFPNWKQNNIGTYKNSEFVVENMSEFLEKVKRYGGKVISEPVKKPWGWISAEIADLDGNVLLISCK